MNTEERKELLKNIPIEQLCNKETYMELYSLPTFDREEMTDSMVERAEKYGVKAKFKRLKRAFEKELSDFKKTKSLEENEGGNITDFDYFDDCHELKCGMWKADADGVYLWTEKGKSWAVYHPILPLYKLRNLETQTDKIVLAFKAPNKHEWETITEQKITIASASKIVSLANKGVLVTSETARNLVNFLADLERFNPIETKISSSKLGWIRDDFIPYDEKISFDAVTILPDLFKAIHERGNYQKWLETIKAIRRNRSHYEPQFCMSVAFASPLLHIFQTLPFIANLWGATGKGKTVAMMCAASIFADPGENKFITDSYSTQNAFEIRLDALNSLPMLIDDMSKVSDKLNDGFTDLVYLLCSGKGKDRSNIDLGLNRVRTWNCAILTNMERPLAVETMRGGAINRILDFEMADGRIFESGNEIVKVLTRNFGGAGKKFIEVIKQLSPDDLEAIREDFERKIIEEAKRQNSEKEEKQVIPLSIVLTADKLATDYIFHDGIYLDLEFCVTQLKSLDEVSEGARAYENIMGFVEENVAAFDPDESFRGKVCGYYSNSKEDGDDEYVYIIPTVFHKIAKEWNFSEKAFCTWAKNKNLLKCSQGRNQYLARVNDKVLRVYAIKLNRSDFVDVTHEEEALFSQNV